MKILIAYYSKSGETKKVAEVIKEELETQGHSVDIEKVKPVKEHSFWGWFFIRLFKGECDIQPLKIQNVAEYDIVCIGSPNWTRLSLPMARYLKEAEGLKYKNVGLFITTAAPLFFKWYIFSTYLFNSTYSKIINTKRGRIVNSILLSSVFKNWNFQSKYGKKVIKSFCDKIIKPIPSYKDYILKQKEIENIHFFTIIFSIFFILSLILHITLNVFNEEFLSWKEYFHFAVIFSLTILLLMAIRGKKTWIFLGKYIGSFSIISLWTLIMLYTELILGLGRVFIGGYFLIFIIIGFFRNYKTVIFSGLISFLGYGILFYIHPAREVFNPILDLTLLTIGCVAVILVTKSLQKHYCSLLEAQDEIEVAKTSLEIKVKARTKELKELSEGLEEKVKKRTEELQTRLKELEKFYKITVNRELKMIKLKNEIKELKKKP